MGDADLEKMEELEQVRLVVWLKRQIYKSGFSANERH